MAAPTWVKNGTRLTKSGGGASALAPTIACTIGNYIVAIFEFNISGAFTAIATPAGWTLLYSRAGSGAQTYRPQIAAFGKVAAATTETCPITTVGTDTYGYGQLIEVSGVASVDATATTSADNADATATTATATAAAALAVADSLVIVHCTAEAGFGGTSSFSTPATTGYTVIGTNADDSATIGYDSSRKTVAVATAPTATWTWTGASRYQWGMVVLSGTGGGGGAINATSTVALPLTGAAGVQVAVGAASTVALPLTGAAAVKVAVAATSTVPLPMAGAATAQVAVGAASTVALPLAGAAQAGVAVGATSSVTLPLVPVSTVRVAVGASSVVALPLGGTFQVGVQIGAVSVVALPLTVAAAVRVAIAAQSSVPLPLTGTATVSGVPQTNITSVVALPLVGGGTVVVAVRADSTVALPLTGAAAARVAIQVASALSLPLTGTAFAGVVVGVGSGVSLPLQGTGTVGIGVGAVSVVALPLTGVTFASGQPGVSATSVVALPLTGTTIVIVRDGLPVVVIRPSRGQLRMAKFWDTVVERLSTPRMEEILGGRGRIYSPFDTPREREGASTVPWGRIQLIARTNLWPMIDVPDTWKNAAWLVSVQFNDFRAKGYRVDIAVEAAHGETFQQLDNFAPNGLEDIIVAVPIWRYAMPSLQAQFDPQRRLWVSNAEYRAQVLPRSTEVVL